MKREVFSQGDPRQKIQICSLCDEPTGRCEDDTIKDDLGNVVCSNCPETTTNKLEGKP